jgi:hypothetical protein
VDILLTGCEVSLWVLEQFASDLHQVVNFAHTPFLALNHRQNLIAPCQKNIHPRQRFCAKLIQQPVQVFPRLKIKCISANKLLGIFGQIYPIPSSGHSLHEVDHNTYIPATSK